MLESNPIPARDGEGNGTPLQYSCLENPMDGGAWQAAVRGVAEDQTRLSDFTFTFHFHALEEEMATTPVFLPGESQGWGSLVGCRLWDRTESDTTEATQQQQQPETLRGLKQILCAPRPKDPTETETELCLSIFCGGTGKQWSAARTGALGAADFGMA